MRCILQTYSDLSLISLWSRATNYLRDVTFYAPQRHSSCRQYLDSYGVLFTRLTPRHLIVGSFLNEYLCLGSTCNGPYFSSEIRGCRRNRQQGSNIRVPNSEAKESCCITMHGLCWLQMYPPTYCRNCKLSSCSFVAASECIAALHELDQPWTSQTFSGKLRYNFGFEGLRDLNWRRSANAECLCWLGACVATL